MSESGSCLGPVAPVAPGEPQSYMNGLDHSEAVIRHPSVVL